jgi:hypothetical protein
MLDQRSSRLLVLVVLLGSAVCRVAADEGETPSALERDPSGWTDLLSQAGPKLEGWTRGPIPPTGRLNPRSQWSLDAATGHLVCEGNGGHEWLRWDKEFRDGIFHVEWRFTPVPGKKGYNSGTEVDGKPQRFNLSKQQKESRVKPAGEWNTFEITCKGKDMTLWVNGAVVNRWHGCLVPHGYLGVEAEGYRIEFRNVKVKPME